MSYTQPELTSKYTPESSAASIPDIREKLPPLELHPEYSQQPLPAASSMDDHHSQNINLSLTDEAFSPPELIPSTRDPIVSQQDQGNSPMLQNSVATGSQEFHSVMSSVSHDQYMVPDAGHMSRTSDSDSRHNSSSAHKISSATGYNIPPHAYSSSVPPTYQNHQPEFSPPPIRTPHDKGFQLASQYSVQNQSSSSNHDNDTSSSIITQTQESLKPCPLSGEASTPSIPPPPMLTKYHSPTTETSDSPPLLPTAVAVDDTTRESIGATQTAKEPPAPNEKHSLPLRHRGRLHYDTYSSDDDDVFLPNPPQRHRLINVLLLSWK